MFTRTHQISSPLLLPLLGSVLTTSIILSILLAPPIRPTLNLQQLLLHAALGLLLAACIHVATVWTIWHLIRDYLEPGAGILAIHIWAAVAWLPLITTLTAERSLWVSCIVPWAFTNAVVFLNLWTTIPQEKAEEPSPQTTLFHIPSAPPLWRTLLPFCITVITAQAGLILLAAHQPWSSAALLSACVLLFSIRHPFILTTPENRRRFSRSTIFQTAAVFFLISTALTPFLQKAYGLASLAHLLAVTPRPIPTTALPNNLGAAWSGIVLTLPPKPHERIDTPTRSEQASLTQALAKPVVIPFDGVYWYFKSPDTQPRPNARIQRGDPIKANVHSTDRLPLAMEAHQTLTTPISTDCCHALRIDLLNGDNRPGPISLELLLTDTSGNSQSVALGTLPIPSSLPERIPLNRPPVHESLRFQLPATARGIRFNEITIHIKPSRNRSQAGSQIAIQNFTLIP